MSASSFGTDSIISRERELFKVMKKLDKCILITLNNRTMLKTILKRTFVDKRARGRQRYKWKGNNKR
uniref:Uncharacterized protein n=1 Tax=Arion vulgaris TaxID=1028688 RepID=A0A0B7AL47_9EUPU